MPNALPDFRTAALLARLAPANTAFQRNYPGEPDTRQPLHTVYGGAQLFKAETPRRLGELALAHLAAYAPDAATLATALGLPGDAALHETVYARTIAKLEREAVEDFRIDFEDGFGNRPDAEEDATAEAAAIEVARALAEGLLPPFFGIRVKPMTEELKARAVRTADLFLTTLLEHTGGKLPENFVITLPKVQIPEQVDVFCRVLDLLEHAHQLPHGALKIELMIEVTQSIFDAEGRSNLPALLAAAGERCTAAHFGTYDYTASCNVTADNQVMNHPVCDFAKHMMQVAYASTGIFLSDGATNVMPVGPHRGDALTPEQRAENQAVVHRAWRLSADHIRHSLRGGFYQGWDLHPGQLPVRYATCFAFFLEGLPMVTERLRNFVEKSAQATLVGDVFDDAATGQGLLNSFLRAYNSGAIGADGIAATGLTLDELQGRSFRRILENRRRL